MGFAAAHPPGLVNIVRGARSASTRAWHLILSNSAGGDGGPIANAPPPLLFGRRGDALVLPPFGGNSFLPLRMGRGGGAPSDAPSVLGRSPWGERRLSALHRGVLLTAPGRAFRNRLAIPAASDCRILVRRRVSSLATGRRKPVPSASSWQGAVVPPGGAPAPPGTELARLRRGRRIPCRRHDAS
jgi:hypothetical protein